MTLYTFNILYILSCLLGAALITVGIIGLLLFLTPEEPEGKIKDGYRYRDFVDRS